MPTQYPHAKNSSSPEQVSSFELFQNYQNQFNPSTKFSFVLPQDAKVNLIICALLGREVVKLVNNEFKVAGRYTCDLQAASLSSGVLFYRLVASSSSPREAEKFSETKRMVLLKN